MPPLRRTFYQDGSPAIRKHVGASGTLACGTDTSPVTPDNSQQEEQGIPRGNVRRPSEQITPQSVPDNLTCARHICRRMNRRSARHICRSQPSKQERRNARRIGQTRNSRSSRHRFQGRSKPRQRFFLTDTHSPDTHMYKHTQEVSDPLSLLVKLVVQCQSNASLLEALAYLSNEIFFVRRNYLRRLQ